MITRTFLIVALLALAACDEDKCQYRVVSSANYQAAFDHCMDKAAVVSKSGTHDNSYDTVGACKDYAWEIDHTMCKEASRK